MKPHTLLIMLSLLVSSIAQGQTTYTFTYDAAGNRIKREVVLLGQSLMQQLNETIPEELEEEITQPETPEYKSLFDEQESDKQTSADAFNVNYYPNPSDGRFTVELPDYQFGDKGNVFIYNMYGNIVYKQNYVANTQVFDITRSMSGLYVIRITVGDKVVSKKLIRK